MYNHLTLRNCVQEVDTFSETRVIWMEPFDICPDINAIAVPSAASQDCGLFTDGDRGGKLDRQVFRERSLLEDWQGEACRALESAFSCSSVTIEFLLGRIPSSDLVGRP